MARLLKPRGEHEKALEWYQHVLDSEEKGIGKDHVNTVQAMAEVFEMQEVREGAPVAPASSG